MTAEDISYSLSVPLAFVQKQRMRIAKAAEQRRKFMMTAQPWFAGGGDGDGGGYLAILQK